jgi:Eukaryotic cytochrome b561
VCVCVCGVFHQLCVLLETDSHCLVLDSSFHAAALSFKRLPLSHNAAKYVHFGCQTVAVVCSTLAIVAVHQFKIASGNNELYVMHTWIGYVSFLLFLLQYLLGAMSFLIPPPYPPVGWRRAFHPVHIVIGTLSETQSSLGVCVSE